MKAGIQKRMLEIGQWGCLALCIIEICQRIKKAGVVDGDEFDVYDVIEDCIDKGYIVDEMYVQYPAKIMEMLVGGKWTYEHSTEPSIDNQSKEFTIERWESKTTAGTSNHFKLPDWDPMGNSQTVRNGKIASYRILRRVG